MANNNYKALDIYGPSSKFLSVLPDGTEIPWRPLSIGAFLKALRSQDIQEDIEDQLFDECVTSDFFKSRKATLKAGGINTVVNAATAYSFPGTSDELQWALDRHRHFVHSNVYEKLVIFICRAFSGYTPRDVESMDFEEFMHSVALAEAKLLETGIIVEPLTFDGVSDNGKRTISSSRDIPVVEPSRPRGDVAKLREAWEAQQHPASEIPQTKDMVTITTRDMVESNAVLGPDMDLSRQKGLEEMAEIYKDYLDIIASGEKLTPERIKSPEQRKAEAIKRMAENERALAEAEANDAAARKKEEMEREALFRQHAPKKKRKK